MEPVSLAGSQLFLLVKQGFRAKMGDTLLSQGCDKARTRAGLAMEGEGTNLEHKKFIKGPSVNITLGGRNLGLAPLIIQTLRQSVLVGDANVHILAKCLSRDVLTSKELYQPSKYIRNWQSC